MPPPERRVERGLAAPRTLSAREGSPRCFRRRRHQRNHHVAAGVAARGDELLQPRDTEPRLERRMLPNRPRSRERDGRAPGRSRVIKRRRLAGGEVARIADKVARHRQDQGRRERLAQGKVRRHSADRGAGFRRAPPRPSHLSGDQRQRVPPAPRLSEASLAPGNLSAAVPHSRPMRGAPGSAQPGGSVAAGGGDRSSSCGSYYSSSSSSRAPQAPQAAAVPLVPAAPAASRALGVAAASPGGRLDLAAGPWTRPPASSAAVGRRGGMVVPAGASPGSAHRVAAPGVGSGAGAPLAARLTEAPRRIAGGGKLGAPKGGMTVAAFEGRASGEDSYDSSSSSSDDADAAVGAKGSGKGFGKGSGGGAAATVVAALRAPGAGQPEPEASPAMMAVAVPFCPDDVPDIDTSGLGAPVQPPPARTSAKPPPARCPSAGGDTAAAVRPKSESPPREAEAAGDDPEQPDWEAGPASPAGSEQWNEDRGCPPPSPSPSARDSAPGTGPPGVAPQQSADDATDSALRKPVAAKEKLLKLKERLTQHWQGSPGGPEARSHA